jgi:sugar O-acyltransferase (sialic acid O-acetyltransferase NeuD family)
MDDIIYGVYGASGFGREVLPIARSSLSRSGIEHEKLVFIDDYSSSGWINGHRVVTLSSFLKLPARQRLATVAIADPPVRERIALALKHASVEPWTIEADNVVKLDGVALGPGAILAPFVTITSNIVIGDHFQANIYSYVAHDCIIGDFVTFAPAVKCNGNVVIEDHAYIGTGAIIRQGRPGQPLRIGRGAVVGMGAVVTKDVAPGVVVVGNPAKPLQKE